MRELETSVLEHVRLWLNSYYFKVSPAELDDAQCYLFFVLFKHLEERAKKCKEALRLSLLERLAGARSRGFEGLGGLQVTQPKAKELNLPEVLRLLESKGLPATRGVQTVVVSQQVVDMTGLLRLVDEGHLTQEEVELCRPVLSPVVKAVPSAEVLQCLKQEEIVSHDS